MKRVLTMEFNKKLQELRKQKGLTQEELAAALYVSRTAISKWESGRGYPNIDSLKAIAQYFDITIDALLSGNELLTIAEEDRKQQRTHLRDLVFGLLDCSTAIFCFLPLLCQRTGQEIQAASLLSLTEISPYLKTAYFIAIIAMVITGIATLALQNCRQELWIKTKCSASLLLHMAGVLLFTISRQPYAAVFLFLLLAIKVLLLLKKQ